MVYTDPKVRFTFSDGTSVVADNVIKDSIKIRKQSLNGLDSSSDTVSFTLAPEPIYYGYKNLTLSGKLITQTSDVKAEVLDGDVLIFTGYVSRNCAWDLSQTGVKPLSVNLESVGVRKLKVPCTQRLQVYRGKVSDVIGYVAGIAGIDVDPNAQEIPKEVYVRLDPSDDCDRLINNILKEYGYYYFFTEAGKLSYLPVNLSSDNSVEKILWASADDSRFIPGDGLLQVAEGTAVGIKRKIADYKQAQVCFPTVEDRKNVSVYGLEDSLYVPEQTWWDGDYHRRVDNPTLEGGFPYLDSYGANGSVQINGWPADAGMVNILATVEFTTDETVQVYGTVFGYKPGVEFTLYSGSTKLDSYTVEARAFQSKYWTDRKTVAFNLKTKNGLVPDRLSALNDSTIARAKILSCEIRLTTSVADAKASTTTASDLDSGKTIWYMDNVRPDGFVQSATTYIRQPNPGDIALEVLADNSWNTESVTVNKFAAIADIVATAVEENYVYASREGTISEPTVDTTYKYKTSYVTDSESAVALAERFAKYYTYCQNVYTFSTSEDIPLGAIVNVKDNMYSALDANVCVTIKSFTIRKGRETVFTYSGYAVSDIHQVDTRTDIISQSRPSYNNRIVQEYIWSNSETDWSSLSRLFTFGGRRIRISGKLIGNQAEQDWMTTVTGNPEGTYLWSRINGGTPFRITGAAGQTFRIRSVSPAFLTRNDTYSADVKQSLTLYAEISGYPNANPVWNVGGVNYRGQTIVVTIPYRGATDTELKLYDGDILKDSLLVRAIDVTDQSIYDGAISSVDNIRFWTDGQTHTFLWTGEDGAQYSGMTMLKNYPYHFNGSGWVSYTGIDASNADSLLVMLRDADGSSSDGVFSWFKNIVAQAAVINELFSREVTLLNGGSIQSQNYSESANKGFRIDSAGNARFIGLDMVNGSVLGAGQFDCPSFSSLPAKSGSETPFYLPGLNEEGQFNYCNARKDTYVTNGIKNVVINGHPEIAYVSGSLDGYGRIYFTFYNSSLSNLGSISMSEYHYAFGTNYTYTSPYPNIELNGKIIMGAGDVFKFKNIPRQSTPDGLEQGQVYADLNGFIHLV